MCRLSSSGSRLDPLSAPSASETSVIATSVRRGRWFGESSFIQGFGLPAGGIEPQASEKVGSSVKGQIRLLEIIQSPDEDKLSRFVVEKSWIEDLEPTLVGKLLLQLLGIVRPL